MKWLTSWVISKALFSVNDGDRIETPGTSIRLTGFRLHHVLFRRVKVEWKSLSKAHFFAPLFSLSPFPKEGQPGVIQSHLGDKLITSFWVSYFFFQSPHLSPPNSYFSPENIFTSASQTCFLFFGNKCIYKVQRNSQNENINFIIKNTF